MIRVLFVCLGNICRSPLAEGLFKKAVEEAGLSNRIEADSAGTSGWHIGDPPDHRTVENARKHGLELHHASRQFIKEDFDRFDYIAVADQSNYSDAVEMAGNNKSHYKKVLKIRKFDTEGDGQYDVPDPYYGNGNHFEHVYKVLTHSTAKLLEHIRAEKGI